MPKWIEVLALAALAFTACGKPGSSPRHPIAGARAATADTASYDLVDLTDALGNGIPSAITDDGIIIGNAYDSTSRFKFTSGRWGARAAGRRPSTRLPGERHGFLLNPR